MKCEVALIETGFDMRSDIEILQTFNDQNQAINHIVNLYIDDLLESNDFQFVRCPYHWRKRDMFSDMFSDWYNFDIFQLQKYDMTNEQKNKINKYLLDYNKWRSKK